MPQDSITRILNTIQPTYMKHLIGTLHIKNLLSTEEDCIIKNLIEFIKHSKWNKYHKSDSEIQIPKNLFPKLRHMKINMQYLTKICAEWNLIDTDISDATCYPKMAKVAKDKKIYSNNVVYALYITLEAYLDSYSVQDVQETLNTLNEKLVQNTDSNVTINDTLPLLKSYVVTEQFIKKYRYIYQMLKELVLLLQNLKDSGDFPNILKIFKNIEILGL